MKIIFILSFFAFFVTIDAVDEFEKETLLTMHNIERAEVAIPPVQWNQKLADFAQSVTDKCVFEHSTNRSYGENLFMGYDKYHTVADAVELWANEKKDYICGNVVKMRNKGEPVVGHYTAIVWTDTKYIGCAYTYCGTKTPRLMILACEYEPRGNWLGQTPFPSENCPDESLKNRLNLYNQEANNDLDNSFNNELSQTDQTNQNLNEYETGSYATDPNDCDKSSENKLNNKNEKKSNTVAQSFSNWVKNIARHLH